MKIYLISLLALVVSLAVVGCNPVGMDETRAYVQGVIYTDSTHTSYAEDVTVIAVTTNESSFYTTGTDGRFFIEVQIYPEGASGSGSSGTTSSKGDFSGVAQFSLTAYYGNTKFEYGGSGNQFVVAGGDTLSLWDIDLTMFQESSSGGSGSN
ncbi:MAG: hypothetical protein GF388_03860 [Candidatus Aegiribacteria sp.]|nr:hypothetical protein [Candidatus Aegiribacteria sp.]MBD3294389.1 hypothetical protein [Candidatus Fermentibacteria bacterium]